MTGRIRLGAQSLAVHAEHTEFPHCPVQQPEIPSFYTRANRLGIDRVCKMDVEFPRLIMKQRMPNISLLTLISCSNDNNELN